jgi:hypothetical protein
MSAVIGICSPTAIMDGPEMVSSVTACDHVRCLAAPDPLCTDADPCWISTEMVQIGSFCAATRQVGACAGSSAHLRDHVDAIALTYPAALVGGRGVDLVEVAFDAARGGDQQERREPAPGPEWVRAPGRRELPAAADG